MASFRSAIRKGARAIEADLRRTKDRVWVVFHDNRLGAVTWEALQRGPVPRLQDLLRFARRRRVLVFLDVKEGGGEKDLLRMIRAFPSVLVGFSKRSLLARVGRMGASDLFWVTGYKAPVTPRRIALAQGLRLSGLVSYKRWVNKDSVKRVHAAGMKLYVWTIKSRPELRKFSALGVDGIMSEVWPSR